MEEESQALHLLLMRTVLMLPLLLRLLHSVLLLQLEEREVCPKQVLDMAIPLSLLVRHLQPEETEAPSKYVRGISDLFSPFICRADL